MILLSLTAALQYGKYDLSRNPTIKVKVDQTYAEKAESKHWQAMNPLGSYYVQPLFENRTAILFDWKCDLFRYF